MDQKKAINIVQQYVGLVKQNYDVKQIYLFGSYAKGDAKEESDIDVAIVLDKIGDDYLAQSTKLFQLRRKIDLRIEPVLLEFNNDISGFLNEIISTGILIYQSD
ncbi:MAG: nucleotidyltransferase domain-containing protein [Candidatus Cloacimonetes bacterium]|nr:nucleotidyltransferase domain-containing protein [Candidatus Cloacimonadota bacterium]